MKEVFCLLETEEFGIALARYCFYGVGHHRENQDQTNQTAHGMNETRYAKASAWSLNPAMQRVNFPFLSDGSNHEKRHDKCTTM